MSLKEKIKKSFASIRYKNLHKGCGTIFNNEGKLYCISAGHVLDEIPTNRYKEIEIETSLGTLKCSEVLDTLHAKSKEMDFIILRVENRNIETHEIPRISFSKAIENPNTKSTSYVFHNGCEEGYFFEDLKYSERKSDYCIRLLVDHGYLEDRQNDLYAADALAGISGSGVYKVDSSDKLILHCIIISIPNRGISQTIGCVCASLIKAFFDNISIIDDDFSLDRDSINSNFELFNDEIKRNAIEKWISDSNNRTFKENFERKLEFLFPKQDVNSLIFEHLERIIDGQKYIADVVQSNTSYYNEYELLEKSASMQNMLYYVDSSNEARKEYSRIERDHLSIIKSDLEEFEKKQHNMIRLSQFGISNWLKICKLDFIENEKD